MLDAVISPGYESVFKFDYKTALFLRPSMHRFTQPHVLPAYSLSCHISFKKTPKAHSVKGHCLPFTGRYTKDMHRIRHVIQKSR